MEFLGDAVLDFVVGAWVYNHFPEMQEGDLTRMRSALVRTDTLADFARTLDLGPALRLGRGELASGGRQRDNLLCATFEALIDGCPCCTGNPWFESLELHGYKTFASRTHFEFADGITSIVGPNGSGKSNIADALRWVLGEQSQNLLRAKKTEDMIFSGSEQRPRAGMASVTITFDNTDGWLPVDFSEVAVTRRAHRDGRNEYLLNGQSVRLKDINELLAQSGLSERTYTILGQGMVDASLALKADERRRLFEEAAGIGLYRSRREETLRRLENTQRNLERVLDILAELEPRLRSLERQSRRAQEYLQVQADLKMVLREWYGYHWHLAVLDERQRSLTASRQTLSSDRDRAADEGALSRERLDEAEKRSRTRAD
jgi:chromosome segregation protein